MHAHAPTRRPAVAPPSMTRTLPVMYEARGEAAKAIASAISDGVATRRSIGTSRPCPKLGRRIGRSGDGFPHHVGLDRAGRDRDCAHVRRQFDRERPRQADERALRCAIGCAAGIAEQACVGGDVDDHAPPAAKPVQKCPRQRPGGGQIDGDGAVPERLAGLRDRRLFEDAGAIDEDVDLADLLCDPPTLGAIGEIAGDGKAAAGRGRGAYAPRSSRRPCQMTSPPRAWMSSAVARPIPRVEPVTRMRLPENSSALIADPLCCRRRARSPRRS